MQTSAPGPVQFPAAQIPGSVGGIPLHTLTGTTTNTNASVSSEDRKNAAWKYEGYEALGRWMASDDEFFVFRRFESLNAGVILWMQDRIVQLETKLKEIHRHIADSPNYSVSNGSFRRDVDAVPEREKIMRELSSILHHYNEYVESFTKVRSRPRASKRHVENIQNWLERQAIDEDEAAFAKQEGDLISIKSRVQLPIGRWLEIFSKLRFSKLFRVRPVQGLPLASDVTKYSNDQKFDQLTNVMVIFVGLVMLLAPMWWLENVSNSTTRLTVITGFICVFMVMMTTATITINKPFEVVAATAAYSAVLMVFMQIDSK